MLQNAKADGVSAAAALTSLVHNQCIEPDFPGQGMATAAVPERMAAVTVEENLHRSPILQMVIPPEKRCAVGGQDPHRLKCVLRHDVADPENMAADGVILFSRQQIVHGSPGFLRGIESNVIGKPAAQQRNCSEN